MAFHAANVLPRFGDAEQFSRWLQEQIARCADRAFARRFAEACPLPGLSAADYGHRLLKLGGETLLAGIRFKGGDTTRPFVDLLAWTGEPEPGWIRAIADEFARFEPLAVRFGWPGDAEPPWRGVVDQHVFAGPARGVAHPQVSPAHDLSWYDRFRDGFEQWQTASPVGSEVSAASAEDLQSCLDDGHVVIAQRGGDFLGVAACKRQAERAFSGWAMIEEFVLSGEQGQGLGTALQRGLMALLPEGDLVWGTIHGNNIPSQRTARRCGRELVETWWFAPTPKQPNEVARVTTPSDSD